MSLYITRPRYRDGTACVWCPNWLRHSQNPERQPASENGEGFSVMSRVAEGWFIPEGLVSACMADLSPSTRQSLKMAQKAIALGQSVLASGSSLLRGVFRVLGEGPQEAVTLEDGAHHLTLTLNPKTLTLSHPCSRLACTLLPVLRRRDLQPWFQAVRLQGGT